MKSLPERMATFGKTTAGLIILGVVAFLIYADTFQAPFVYDDGLNITNNPNIRMTELSWTGVVDVLESRSVNSTNRPFAALTLALNYYFHRYDVFGYHLVKVLEVIRAPSYGKVRDQVERDLVREKRRNAMLEIRQDAGIVLRY